MPFPFLCLVFLALSLSASNDTTNEEGPEDMDVDPPIEEDPETPGDRTNVAGLIRTTAAMCEAIALLALAAAASRMSC